MQLFLSKSASCLYLGSVEQNPLILLKIVISARVTFPSLFKSAQPLSHPQIFEFAGQLILKPALKSRLKQAISISSTKLSSL